MEESSQALTNATSLSRLVASDFPSIVTQSTANASIATTYIMRRDCDGWTTVRSPLMLDRGYLETTDRMTERRWQPPLTRASLMP
jgi:hypothetical protein